MTLLFTHCLLLSFNIQYFNELIIESVSYVLFVTLTGQLKKVHFDQTIKLKTASAYQTYRYDFYYNWNDNLNSFESDPKHFECLYMLFWLKVNLGFC